MMSGEDVDRRVVLRDHRRPKPMTQTLGQLKKVAKAAEHTLGRKMATFEGGQFVVLVKALRLSRSGEVHGSSIYSHFVIVFNYHPIAFFVFE